MSDDPRPSSLSTTLIRSSKIAAIVLGLVLVGLVVTSWLAGDPADLPFEYEGFD
ncbi:MAG: hypothetical protein ACQGVK_10315 [Myxococcota bacterium]